MYGCSSLSNHFILCRSYGCSPAVSWSRGVHNFINGVCRTSHQIIGASFMLISCSGSLQGDACGSLPFSFANYIPTVVEFCLRNQAMTFKRFPFEVQLNMVEYLVSVRDVGWTRNGIRIGTTSSGMDELIESSRKVWTHESEWCIYMQDRRASRIAGRFFYQLLRDVYVGRIRREADHTSLSIVELEIGLQELYIDIAARARALGVDPTEASIPEDAAARLGLRAHALL